MTASPDPSPPDADQAPRIAPAVLALIVVTCLPELILLAADYGIVGSARWRPLAYQYGAFWAGIWHGWTPNYAAQAWTMSLTYALLHGGPGHLAGNMATLLGLGRIVVDRAGQSRFLLLYLISTLGGALAFGLMTISPSPMVGASGALFGLAGAWLYWEAYDRKQAGYGRWTLVLVVIAGLALMNAVMWATTGGLLAWQTHLGGFVAGWICAAVMTARTPAKFAPAKFTPPKPEVPR